MTFSVNLLLLIFLTKLQSYSGWHLLDIILMHSNTEIVMICSLFYFFVDPLKIQYTQVSAYALLLKMICLCWGLTSQSTIFQSCRDGASASWVINQYFRGVKCLAQGHNTAAVGLEPPESDTLPLSHRAPLLKMKYTLWNQFIEWSSWQNFVRG